MARFRSKVDVWLGTTLVLAIAAQLWGAAVIIGAGGAVRWIAAPPLIIGSFFMLWILTTTYYVVTDADLLVRCGPMRVRIPLNQISNVQPTRKPLSSPALSLDRLLISYGSGCSCMISPKDRDRFLGELRGKGVHSA